MKELTLALLGFCLIAFYQNCSPVHDNPNGEGTLTGSSTAPPNVNSLDPFIAAQLSNDCLACHKGLGDFPATTRTISGEDIWKAGWVANDDPESALIIAHMEATDSSVMPPASEGGAWAQTDINVIRAWISQLDMGGGGGGGGGTPTPTPTPVNVTYTADIAPIITQHCAGCHVNQTLGGVDLSDYAGVRAQVDTAGNDPFLSPLYGTTFNGINDPADPVAMPRGGGGPIAQAQLDLIEAWIKQGSPQ